MKQITSVHTALFSLFSNAYADDKAREAIEAIVELREAFASLPATATSGEPSVWKCQDILAQLSAALVDFRIAEGDGDAATLATLQAVWLWGVCSALLAGDIARRSAEVLGRRRAREGRPAASGCGGVGMGLMQLPPEVARRVAENLSEGDLAEVGLLSVAWEMEARAVMARRRWSDLVVDREDVQEVWMGQLVASNVGEEGVLVNVRTVCVNADHGEAVWETLRRCRRAGAVYVFNEPDPRKVGNVLSLLPSVSRLTVVANEEPGAGENLEACDAIRQHKLNHITVGSKSQDPRWGQFLHEALHSGSIKSLGIAWSLAGFFQHDRPPPMWPLTLTTLGLCDFPSSDMAQIILLAANTLSYIDIELDGLRDDRTPLVAALVTVKHLRTLHYHGQPNEDNFFDCLLNENRHCFALEEALFKFGDDVTHERISTLLSCPAFGTTKKLSIHFASIGVGNVGTVAEVLKSAMVFLPGLKVVALPLQQYESGNDLESLLQTLKRIKHLQSLELSMDIGGDILDTFRRRLPSVRVSKRNRWNAIPMWQVSLIINRLADELSHASTKKVRWKRNRRQQQKDDLVHAVCSAASNDVCSSPVAGDEDPMEITEIGTS